LLDIDVDEQDVRRWTEPAGRFGLAARGFIYCVAAVVAVAVAFGRTQERVDRRGALDVLARQRYGSVVLVVLAAGFAGYAAWRFVRAATGAREGGKKRTGPKGYARRAGDIGAGAIYVTLFVVTVRLLAHQDPGDGGDQRAKSWSAKLLDHHGGRVVIVIAGLAFVVVGVVLFVRGVRQRFERHLRVSDMRVWQRRWLPWLGTAGYAARGVIVVLVGLFFVQTAATYDPNKAVGIDGALHRLRDRAYGPAALTVVAIGLLAFGLFSFVEARWRKVLE
jgi:hypothetical protein